MTASQYQVFSANPLRKVPSAFAVLKVDFSFSPLFQPRVAEAKSLLSRNRHTRRDAYQSQQGMRKMNQQKTKYQIKKDMDSFKEKVNMKEETRTPKKLLSHKGAIDCPEH
jgi:hypothetical protein